MFRGFLFNQSSADTRMAKINSFPSELLFLDCTLSPRRDCTSVFFSFSAGLFRGFGAVVKWVSVCFFFALLRNLPCGQFWAFAVGEPRCFRKPQLNLISFAQSCNTVLASLPKTVSRSPQLVNSTVILNKFIRFDKWFLFAYVSARPLCDLMCVCFDWLPSSRERKWSSHLTQRKPNH